MVGRRRHISFPLRDVVERDGAYTAACKRILTRGWRLCRTRAPVSRPGTRHATLLAPIPRHARRMAAARSTRTRTLHTALRVRAARYGALAASDYSMIVLSLFILWWDCCLCDERMEGGYS